MNIRQMLRDEDALFHDQSANRNQLVDYSFFSTHSALMARTYVDKPSVKWDNIGTGVQ